MSKPPKLNPYERLYKKQLGPEKAAEIRHNLIGYFRTLIEMDRQYKEFQEKKSNLTESDSK